MHNRMDLTFHLLQTITNGFSEEQKVGHGGFGDVYRAVHNGEEIAVKKLYPLQGVDDTEFDNEFRNLNKVQHPNIVRLVGYCYESRDTYVEHKGQLVRAKETERVLCFEYMQGGSLEQHIRDEESCGLDWPTCYKIIRGTCAGLNHLHSAQENPIYHLDIKTANILLDKNKTPKIADLGLSRLLATTKTHMTVIIKGTHGYMPPEYIDKGYISKKFDVFSLGVLIIKIMAGNKGYVSYSEMHPEQFIELVIDNWSQRLQGTSRYSSHKIDILRVKACIEIALKCVEVDRDKRPAIKDIVHELDGLEAEIKKMSLLSDQSKDRVGQMSSDYKDLGVDPSLELRFPFELRKDISCCLQLTNKTDDFIAFKIKTNQKKYCTQPNIGTMPPCSKRYITITLQAQEKAPPNMQCHDMFLVQSTRVSKDLTSDEITEDLFKKAMADKAVVEVNLPIVYVALEQPPL